MILDRRTFRLAGAGLIALLACSDSDPWSADGGPTNDVSGASGSAAGAPASGRDGAATGGTGSPAAGSSAAGRGGSSGAGGTGAGSGGGGGSGSGGTPSDAGPAAGDAAAAGDGALAQCTACDDYAAPVLLANVQVAALDALSGIAVSARNPDTLYAHNDRNSTELFALGFDGQLRARYALSGVTTVDLEEVAVGPCPAGSCVFIADIGGNIGVRNEYALLRAPEPDVSAASAAGAATPLAGLERFPFTYEDGMHNAEGILIDPDGGALYVVTKVGPPGQPSSVYALPDPLAAAGNVARKVADLPVPRAGDSPATATNAHPCGRGFLLRTNRQLYEFRIASGMPFSAAFAADPVALTAGNEPQSEAVSYLPDGSGFVTSGEMAAAPIYRSLCR